jgi:division protein CdvB (Snf7/Vps24/ESCRT-III family)
MFHWDFSMNFAKRWENKNDSPPLEKIVEKVNPSTPLKDKLESSIRRIETECKRLDQSYERLQKQDKILFDQAVECYKEHDQKRAGVYAIEIAENRKLQKMVLQAKLALEVVALRARASTELGDIAVTLMPVVNTLNGIQEGIATITPQTEKNIGEMDGLLNGMVIDLGLVVTDPFTFQSSNEGTSKILEEAQTIAESKINHSFPALPSNPFGQTIREDDSTP